MSFLRLLGFVHQKLLVELLSVFNRLRSVSNGSDFALNHHLLLKLIIELMLIELLQILYFERIGRILTG